MSPPLSPATLETVTTSLRWERGEKATFWVLHPEESGITSSPPYSHARGSEALKVLSAAIQEEAKSEGPAFIVVPELTLHPDDTSVLLKLANRLGDNKALIVGLGHLTSDQCEAIESGVTDRFADDWPRGRYANPAIVVTGGNSPIVRLEAKKWPSKWEQERSCHQACRGPRVYCGTGFKFAVAICSELEGTGTGDAERLVDGLQEAGTDVLFWLQHNPSPRNETFTKTLTRLFATLGDNPLIVSANKRSNHGRDKYGGSGLIVSSHCFPPLKAEVPQSKFVATECIASTPGVTRALLARYDVPAHRISTTLPRDTPRDSGGCRTFMHEVVPYTLSDEDLTANLDQTHMKQLFSRGRETAKSRSREQGLCEARYQLLAPKLDEAEASLSDTMAGFLDFLDRSLPQDGRNRTHGNHESHRPVAAGCDCWKHRRNYDSIFRDSGRGDTPLVEYVSELALGLAAAMEAGGRIALKEGVYGNIGFEGVATKLILAVDETTERRFQREYFGDRLPVSSVKAIVLEGRRTIAEHDASQALGEGLDGAQAEAPLPILLGSEFWSKVDSSSLLEWLRG